ncbi:MAG: sugar transferase [Chitinivibrionales bacterium]|nr:sugar transferase [Chitinivibrionales bacterium]
MGETTSATTFSAATVPDSRDETQTLASVLKSTHAGERTLLLARLARSMSAVWGREACTYVTQFLSTIEFNALCVELGDGVKTCNASTAACDAYLSLRSLRHNLDIDRALAQINDAIMPKGFFICSSEILTGKRARLFARYGKLAGCALWACDFVINRIIPRMPLLTKAYFRFTRGRYYSISKAEVLGRLVRAGFLIHDFSEIDGRLYTIAQKHQTPTLNDTPSFYPVVRLTRVGKHYRMIRVCKLRTMHPYSEYLQGLMIELNGYNESGKPADDFRVTPWGRFLRRTWLDELPQLLNICLGQMKLVGVRPLSIVRFREFPYDLQEQRTRHTPGCVPPYVSLNMPNASDNIEAERLYLRDLDCKPFTTDFVYLARAAYNVFGRRIRGA